MNLNKGCIEMAAFQDRFPDTFQMNLNKGCIEIEDQTFQFPPFKRMNLNKGCIEISQDHDCEGQDHWWTLTRVVLK